MPTSLADLEMAFLATKGATAGSLSDRRAQVYVPTKLAYFQTLSGLSASVSLADHQLAYYRGLAALPTGSLSDCQRVVWGG